LCVTGPDGREIEVAVPEGVGPGDEFELEIGGAGDVEEEEEQQEEEEEEEAAAAAAAAGEEEEEEEEEHVVVSTRPSSGDVRKARAKRGGAALFCQLLARRSRIQ
jgi:hypothetical protein